MDNLKITGIEELQAVLKQLGDQATVKMGGSLFRQGTAIMTEAKEQTPVDTGVLKASGHVEEPIISGSQVSVQLGFGGVAGEYAVIVHENLNAAHPTGKAKFLEDPVLAHAGTFEHDLAADLKFDVGR